MNLKRQLIYTLIAYLNPISIYWFKAYYRANLEMISAIIFSIVITLLLFFIFNKLKLLKKGFIFLMMFSFLSLCISIIWLILSQLMFADRVFGFSELGFNIFLAYFGSAILAPVFIINLIICIFTNFFFLKRMKK